MNVGDLAGEADHELPLLVQLGRVARRTLLHALEPTHNLFLAHHEFLLDICEPSPERPFFPLIDDLDQIVLQLLPD